MPGFADPSDLVAAGWRKRKRDHEDSATLTKPPTFGHYRVDRPDRESNCSLPLSRHPTETDDLSFRPRCLPRKRRHVQTPYLTLPTHQQSSLLSPNVYASPQDPYSPPVSPKSLVPLPYPTTSPSALRPCHICHRRPTTRQVLDAYADCDLCGERACFICLRQCDALTCPGINPSTKALHQSDIYTPNETLDISDTVSRRKICSSCAVEGVTEAGMEIVRCLDCVHGHAATSWSTRSMPSGWPLDAMNLDRMNG
ncbi:hypothetical protein N7478_012116 [Penicillium angulare]|uniref:uncharacterized protein n=1 Tax=Penicillium angulare TaxID=116970 RepID=UPI002540927B|nr:uncharacterized protein N7478_012116 [Penicillium angulare]KAJ5260511.1 hypothetical protein N7478_012116 [Penicillium angulare]